jgi:hypothetical protein
MLLYRVGVLVEAREVATGVHSEAAAGREVGQQLLLVVVVVDVGARGVVWGAMWTWRLLRGRGCHSRSSSSRRLCLTSGSSGRAGLIRWRLRR